MVPRKYQRKKKNINIKENNFFVFRFTVETTKEN